MSHSASIAGAKQDLEVSIDWLVATLDSMDDTEETHAPHALDGTDSSTGESLLPWVHNGGGGNGRGTLR
jgi:hypothetical protein